MPSSAPCSRAKASLSPDEATAITRAPISLAISTAARPAPPAAPSTATVSPGLRCGAILQAMQRRAVGDGDARRDLVADAVGNRNRVLCLGDDLLAAAIAADKGHDPLPRLELGDVGAQALDHAGDLRSRREGKRRGDLVFVAQHERIEEVEADRRHSDEHIAGPRARLRHLLEASAWGPPNSLNCATRIKSASFCSHQACGRQGL